MQFNPNQVNGPGAGGVQKPGILSKIVAFVVTVAVASVALMFSVFLFAVAIVVGLFIWAYLWWKMRGIRKQMEKQMKEHGDQAGMWQQHFYRRSENGDVLEGEVIREVDEPEDNATRR